MPSSGGLRGGAGWLVGRCRRRCPPAGGFPGCLPGAAAIGSGARAPQAEGVDLSEELRGGGDAGEPCQGLRPLDHGRGERSRAAPQPRPADRRHCHEPWPQAGRHPVPPQETRADLNTSSPQWGAVRPSPCRSGPGELSLAEGRGQADITLRMTSKFISIRGAREHNLKNVSLDLPREQLVVITGLSGSGKSSLAFDTIYAEGQRRYVESLSAYARQFLDMMQKPDVDHIEGLSPAISIEQKTTSRNPRSTVGTVTEIYDYMRLLWARVGIPYSPATGLPIESQTVSQMVDRVLALPEGTRLYLLAPIARGRKGEYSKEFAELQKKGFQRRQDRRQVLRDRRGADPRQEVQARHRRGGRPHRGAPRHRRAARRLLRDGARADRRRHRHRRVRRRDGEADDLLGEVRLPRVRLHHRGDRAAAVLLQQPLRRLSRMRRARHRAVLRAGAGGARRKLEPRARRHRPLGAHLRQLALLPADAGIARPRLSPADDQAVEVAAGGFPPGGAVRLRRGRDHLHL